MSTKTLTVEIGEELLQLLEKEAKRLSIDVSTYVGWCIRTGLSLKDLNRFIRSRSEESE